MGAPARPRRAAPRSRAPPASRAPGASAKRRSRPLSALTPRPPVERGGRARSGRRRPLRTRHGIVEPGARCRGTARSRPRRPSGRGPRASVQPHRSAYIFIAAGPMASISAEHFPSQQLPHVEVALARRRRRLPSMPSEEDVARRLHRAAGLRPPVGPAFANRLRPRNGSSTEAWASLDCRNSGSCSSRPSSSTIQARVPTLPTPTTLRATSARRKLLEQRGGGPR